MSTQQKPFINNEDFLRYKKNAFLGLDVGSGAADFERDEYW